MLGARRCPHESTPPDGEGVSSLQRDVAPVAVAVAQRTPDPLVLRALAPAEVFASAGGKAGSRECPSDAKAARSNTKVAAGDLESRR
jgi:hypothetical protein